MSVKRVRLYSPRAKGKRENAKSVVNNIIDAKRDVCASNIRLNNTVSFFLVKYAQYGGTAIRKGDWE
jgi:hypothetical protein